MKRAVTIDSQANIVADYIQRITTFRGPMPRSDSEMPMNRDDQDKPIWPSVILPDGAIDLHHIQRRTLPNGRIKLWMDGYEWRMVDGVLFSNGTVHNGALRFMLTPKDDACRMTVICDIAGFAEYAKAITRMTKKRF